MRWRGGIVAVCDHASNRVPEDIVLGVDASLLERLRPAADGRGVLVVNVTGQGAADLGLEAGETEVLARHVLQREGHLEQRRPAEVARGVERLDELLEREVLMRERAEELGGA